MSSSTDDRIPVGYVRRAHGIKGDVVVRSLSDFPDRFAPGAELTTNESPPRTLVVERATDHRDGVLIHFRGIEGRTEAEHLQGVTVAIRRAERRELEDDEYWPEDLEGMVAITPDGEHLGTVVGVVLAGAQDRLVVRDGNGNDVEVPFVNPIVSAVHPSGGHVVIDAPAGLFADGD